MESGVNTILAIEQACFGEPWGHSAVKSAVENEHSVFIIEDYGYAIGTCLAGECELHRIAVLPEHRSKGLAFSLLERFLEKCNGKVFLEVASKNTNAVKLYEKCGFIEIAHRKNYYENDDGIVYQLTVSRSRKFEN